MISSLRLERFKSFKDAELQLGPLTVLIGANASGKSNIRDAFRFLHGIGRGYSLAEIIGEKYGEGGERVWTGIRGGPPEIAFGGGASFALKVEMLLASPSGSLPPVTKNQKCERRRYDYRIEVELDRKPVTPVVVSERFGDERSNPDLVGTLQDGELRVHGVSHDGQEYDVLRGTADHPFIYTIANPFGKNVNLRSFDNSLNIYTNANLWCNRIRRMRFFDWLLDAIRQPSFPGQDVLSDNGRNLSSVLQAICQDDQAKRNLLSWIEELTPMDAVDFEFSADPMGRVLATLVEKNGQRITLGSASDGTLRFLSYLAAFLGPHPSSFYFFEELENGIHPTRLSLLLDLVENQVKNKNIQVVATTHSPELLGYLSEESLEHVHLVFRLPDEPDTRVIRILDMPDAQRLIKRSRLAHLFAAGWFETTARFMQPDPDEVSVAVSVPRNGEENSPA